MPPTQDPKNKGVICWREELDRTHKEKGDRLTLSGSKKLNKDEEVMFREMLENMSFDRESVTDKEQRQLEDSGEIPKSAKECLDEAGRCDVWIDV